MNRFPVVITSINHINHDVLKIVTEKPPKYSFTPGQATEVSIKKIGWEVKKRPFTFTCLPADDFLEFTIKTYPEHKGVTKELLMLKKNDELIIHDVFGTITYKEEGLFIAGGAGITPFISILRDLHLKKEIGNNKLIFSNKTQSDIILAEEFEKILGENFINILSEEENTKYANGMITEGFLSGYINDNLKNIYLCGPPPMMEAVEKQLVNLYVNEKIIVKEAI